MSQLPKKKKKTFFLRDEMSQLHKKKILPLLKRHCLRRVSGSCQGGKLRIAL